MSRTLSSALDDARRLAFVGREAELAAYDRALAGAGDVRVLFVHGPGGIGKTTLLDELRRRAYAAGRRPVGLDGRDVGGSIPLVEAAVATAGPAPVLLVDSYELLTPLDRWFREQLLPSLPGDAVAVLAGREPPAPAWSTDAGWRRVLQVVDLTALAPAESGELLARLGVPADRREGLARLGRGHPLALALLAEAGAVPGRLDELPGLVAELCRVLVRDVPDDAHRTGLATCAHAYRTTEDLLARTVGPRAPEVWAWLASRPFARLTGDGLHLHDLVRDVFDAEIAHRNPEAYLGLHREIRRYAVERLLDPSSPTRPRDAIELHLLHRHAPYGRQLERLRETGVLPVAHATPADHAEVLALLAALEGPEQAALCERWLRAQPGGLYVARSDAGVEAFTLHVYVSDDDVAVPEDPLVRVVLDAVRRRAPLRPGERVGIGRWLGSRSGSPRHPMTVLAGAASSLQEWLVNPVGWTVVAALDEEFWRPMMEYLGLAVIARHGPVTAYGWDRRRLPLESFLELTGRRELSGETGPPPAELLRPAPLSRPDFEAAVRAGLRDLGRPDRLAGSPLAGTALGPDVAAALVAGIARLGTEPRGEALCRVLDRTYRHGTPSQEAAAEVLGLPFSTYRRHLTRATARLVDLLWSVEIGVSTL